MYYLDSNMCIYYLRGKFPKVRERILSIPADNIRIPVIVKAELLTGAYKSNARDTVLTKVEAFLSVFEVDDFTDKAAYEYADIRERLEKAGTPIGPNDLIIAAIVRSNGGILITHNTKEFERIEGLKIEDWTI